ncbi:hypothetical protein HDU96_010361 [Phlyctochytrium bullatum]|nr:hypothetical protein HDU96_010361 [Phlyctochytrium bullatum]
MRELLFLARGNFAALAVNTVVLLLIILQYYFLISAGIRLSPSNWPTLLDRYFRAISSDCQCQLPPLSLQEDTEKAPNCALDRDAANVLFDILGLTPMTGVERSELFRSLDVDRDGRLRWPELTRPHVWVDNGRGVDIGNPANVSMWELTWITEVWRRGRDAKAAYGAGERVLSRWGILYGSGLDSSMPEFFY